VTTSHVQEATERADPRTKKRDELVIPTLCGRQLYIVTCVCARRLPASGEGQYVPSRNMARRRGDNGLFPVLEVSELRVVRVAQTISYNFPL